MSYDFDLFVIGGGSGGIATARRAAEYGAKVGVAEYSKLGGTCVNRGCIPKKLMVYASHFPELFTDAEGYGWSAVNSQLDWPKMIASIDNELLRLNGIYQTMLDKSKVEVIPARAKFIDNHTLQVGERTVTADKILIAVGGYPFRPEIPGIEHALISDEMFYLPTQPKKIVILGAGYIGCEFACIMNGLGTEVTQIIRPELILRSFDSDIRSAVQEGMIRHGVNIINNAQDLSIEKTDNGVSVTVITKDGKQTVLADAISLAALGRKPNTANLGLENVNVKTHEGAILVDASSQTNVENIYAVGDCTDEIQLTPVAVNEGRAFADTVFGNKPRVMNYADIPTAVFTTPEAATVGLTEEEAREMHGDNIKIYRSNFRPMYYVLPNKQDRTLMKLVVDSKTDRILGAHMVGDHAAEIIQGVAIAVKMGAKKADFDATVGIHPSSAEEFVTMR
ncbi:glutathione-disulfide reductase [Chamaesiphon minutus]|uniref:Glutathione reductase n=1 Tax=Chamaesiphon minutus (strain ATCC 27169 / PCC 6605) TaxID=1173020 RepID=K9UA55_CHAP6|nr:glutathione-disulfide reductase [Chamaesiphon minutus]AFY91715.1 glutathione-disulfide reductase, plant [Chamaesiphon minutus PCC 6605]